MTPIGNVRGFVPFLVIVALQAAVALDHSAVLYNVIAAEHSGTQALILVATVNVLVLLPLVLMFSPAGFIADKYPHATVIRYAALGGLGVALCYAGSYYLGLFSVA